MKMLVTKIVIEISRNVNIHITLFEIKLKLEAVKDLLRLTTRTGCSVSLEV